MKYVSITGITDIRKCQFSSKTQKCVIVIRGSFMPSLSHNQKVDHINHGEMKENKLGIPRFPLSI